MQLFDVILIAIPILLVAAAILYWYISYRRRRRRVAALAALAINLGWTFDPEYVGNYGNYHAPFSRFAKGRLRRTFNTLSGAFEIRGTAWHVRTGDFTYKTTSGGRKRKTTQTHYLSYFLVKTSLERRPAVDIRREGLFDRFAEAMGFDDIDFESNEFSERFHVKSPDKNFAYAIVHPRMMEFLLESDAPTIEMREGSCCFVRGKGLWSADEFATTADWARQFCELLPQNLDSRAAAGQRG
jgi:hypothetical protein